MLHFMETHSIAPQCVEKGTIPAGIIHWRASIDHFNNAVSLVHFADMDHPYRLVHFTTPDCAKQRAILYGGKDRFIRINYSSAINQREGRRPYADMLGYRLTWPAYKSGHVCQVRFPPGASNELEDCLSKLAMQELDQFIILVLSQVRNDPSIWTAKEEARHE